MKAVPLLAVLALLFTPALRADEAKPTDGKPLPGRAPVPPVSPVSHTAAPSRAQQGICSGKLYDPLAGALKDCGQTGSKPIFGKGWEVSGEVGFQIRVSK